MKISFFGFHFLETHVQRKWQLNVRHFILQNKKLKSKTFFGHFDQKQKCFHFSSVYLIAIETLICHREIKFTSFGFAQNT